MLAIEMLPDWLARVDESVAVSGPGLHVYQRRLPAGVAVAVNEDWEPRPESLLRLGLVRYRAGESDDVWPLEPLYLRASSAEEKWNATGAPKRER